MINNLTAILGGVEYHEEWRDIFEYEGVYMVSNFGRVKSLEKYIKHPNGGQSLRKEMLLKQPVSKQGYCHLELTSAGRRKNYYVHRIVAAMFLENKENKPEVNHKDCNKINNFYLNLEWATSKENSVHANKNGRNKKRFGEQNNFFGKRGILNARSKKAVQLFSNGDKKVWDSITEAAASVNVSVSCIKDCLTGRQKTSAGYKWEQYNKK